VLKDSANKKAFDNFEKEKKVRCSSLKKQYAITIEKAVPSKLARNNYSHFYENEISACT